VEDVLTDLKSSTNHKATVNVSELHPIKGDYALMKQVMVNLVSNAVKYSSKKENPVVDITSKIEDDTAIFTVSDNGAGFEMQYADKLFGVFQRLHKQGEFEGTGVGLATVQRIINKHGGTILAEAELGKGARFWFRIPAA